MLRKPFSPLSPTVLPSPATLATHRRLWRTAGPDGQVALSAYSKASRDGARLHALVRLMALPQYTLVRGKKSSRPTANLHCKFKPLLALLSNTFLPVHPTHLPS